MRFLLASGSDNLVSMAYDNLRLPNLNLERDKDVVLKRLLPDGSVEIEPEEVDSHSSMDEKMSD